MHPSAVKELQLLELLAQGNYGSLNSCLLDPATALENKVHTWIDIALRHQGDRNYSSIDDTVKEYLALAEALSKSYLYYWANNPSLAAELLKVIVDYLPSLAQDWAKIGLASQDLVLRDSSVVALERLGTEEAIVILSQHQESVVWLAEYIDKVLEHESKY